MINYPNNKNINNIKISTINRGKSLEDKINSANKYYLDNNIAVIYKKPTPIQVVEVLYPKRSQAIITKAFYKLPSTTDYNGLYKGYYIDFEAKQTRSKTSFPISNIHKHQLDHLLRIKEHGGISFVIIEFVAHNMYYLLDSTKMIKYLRNMHKKSLPYQWVKDNAILIESNAYISINYIKAIDYLISEDKTDDRKNKSCIKSEKEKEENKCEKPC